MREIGLRFIDRATGEKLSAKECLECLAEMGEAGRGSFGWHMNSELRACRDMLDSSEEECEKYLQKMEVEGGSRLAQWWSCQ
jgi:hypothetical protein